MSKMDIVLNDRNTTMNKAKSLSHAYILGKKYTDKQMDQ